MFILTIKGKRFLGFRRTPTNFNLQDENFLKNELEKATYQGRGGVAESGE